MSKMSDYGNKNARLFALFGYNIYTHWLLLLFTQPVDLQIWQKKFLRVFNYLQKAVQSCKNLYKEINYGNHN